MNENVNLMMKHMLRLAEAYEKLLKEVVQLRQEVAILKGGKVKEKKIYLSKSNSGKKSVLSDISKEELDKRRIPVYSYLL